MAVSVRSASSNSQESGTSCVAALPAGTLTGDLLIAVHGSDQDGSLAAMTAPTGWSLAGSDGRTGVGFVKVWTKTATSSEPSTYTFPDSGSSDASLVILAVTGHDGANPLAVSPVFAGNTTATASHTAPSVSGVAGGLLVTGHFTGGAVDATRSYTPPSGMTEHADTSLATIWTAIEVNSLALAASGATGTKTATLNRSDPFTALSLVVAPAGTSPTSVSFRAATDDARGVTNPADPALPPGTASGDLLIAVQTSDLNGSLASMTAPAGWTERGSSSRSDVGFMKVWTKVATASEPATYTFSDSTSAQGSAIVIAVTGQDATSPLAVTPTFSSGAAATTHPASSAAGVAGGMLITAHLAGTAGTLQTYTVPSGMTTAETSSLTAGNAPNILTGAYYLALSTAGQTGTKSATCSASTPYVTMSLVVAPVTNTVVVTPGTAGSIGAAQFAAGSSASFALTADNPVRLTGKANAPTVSTVSTGNITAGRGSATGKANNATVTVSSTTSTTVTAGATASGTAYGSNTGAVFGFNVISSVPQGSTGLFPSETLFPSEGLFPSAGEGAAAQTVSPPGITSGEAVGSPVVSVADGPQSIIATSIGSAEAIGVPTITTEVGPQDVTAAGDIGTAEVVGRPSLSVEVGAPPPPPPAAQYLDTYYVDGIDLAQFTTQIEVAEGLQDTPGTFGEDVVLPGRDGLLEVWGGPGQQRRPDGPGKVIFSMWLLGVDPVSGALLDPADSAAAYQARWDELVRMFHRRRITIDHPRPDGTRRAVGYLTPQESMAPASRAASPWFGRFKASVTIPAGHWTDPTEVTTGPTPLTNNGGLSLSPWSAATAPCTELVITFGPGNNPRLSTSYGFVGWNGTIAPGRELTIDTVSGQLGYGGGQVWTPAYDGLVYSPGPRLFEIDPSEPLQAVLTHTGGGSMSVEVSGKRRYRTS